MVAILIDSYPESNSNGSFPLSRFDPGVAQSFLGTGDRLRLATFQMYSFDSPLENLRAKLYTHAGIFGTSSVPTGSPLVVSEPISGTVLTSTPTLYTFRFKNQPILTNGVPYCISVETEEFTGFEQINVGRETGSPTHPGNWSSNYGGWYPNSLRDLIFYLYDIIPVGFNLQLGLSSPKVLPVQQQAPLQLSLATQQLTSLELVQRAQITLELE